MALAQVSRIIIYGLAMGKIGILGGTFDPIHFGHLNLAFEMMEARLLDKIWFCPAKINPHKLDQTPEGANDRIKMLELAIGEIPQFEIVDIELYREGPSYTIDTLRELASKEKTKKIPDQLNLIIGEDAVPGFFHWRQPEEIIKLATLLVGSRSFGTIPCVVEGNPEICEAIRKGMTRIHLMDISGTEIRKRLREKKYIGHLVPAKVVDYIYSHQLYFKP